MFIRFCLAQRVRVMPTDNIGLIYKIPFQFSVNSPHYLFYETSGEDFTFESLVKTSIEIRCSDFEEQHAI